MFLTKESLRKILTLVACYCALGCIAIVFALIFALLGIDVRFLIIIAIITLVLGILFFFWGRYAEGKGKLINLGNVLVRKDLRPAEFLKKYEELQNKSDLIIKKPSLEILRLVAVAYDILDDKEKCLSTVNEMLTVVSGKKLMLVELIKISYLFNFGKFEEAEKYFIEIKKRKMSAYCNWLADVILKSDRAIAMGDFSTAEVFYLKILEQSFPKPDPLGALIAHYTLGVVYVKIGRVEDAVLHYRYCVENGGETAIKINASLALEKIQ